MENAEIGREKSLLEQAALIAFNALLTQYRGSKTPIKAIARDSWEAANLFLRASFENDARTVLNRYESAINEYKGVEALRRVLALDGCNEGVINCVVKYYEDEPDPLAAYGKADPLFGGLSMGQTLIRAALKDKDAA